VSPEARGGAISGVLPPSLPEHLDEMLVDADGRQWTSSVPLSKVHPTVTATRRSQMGDLLPPEFAGLIDQAEQYSLQAIYSTRCRPIVGIGSA
jgi:hypothetical protein